MLSQANFRDRQWINLADPAPANEGSDGEVPSRKEWR
jgi:hypothetical protein